MKEGDWFSMSGEAGEIYENQLPIIELYISGDFEILMKWIDETRKFHIEVNAETQKDAQQCQRYLNLEKKRKMLLLNYYYIKSQI